MTQQATQPIDVPALPNVIGRELVPKEMRMAMRCDSGFLDERLNRSIDISVHQP
jgi:hypothetical protein